MIEPSLLHHLIELIAELFKPSEINEIGRIIVKDYDNHTATDTKAHITLSTRKCAAALVETCMNENKVDKLVQMIVELDGRTLMGRPVKIDGLELLLHDLSKSGIIYDFHKKKILNNVKDLKELANWGSLKDGREYGMSVMSLDIVNNSKLVKTHGNRSMQKLYYELRLYLQNKIDVYDGRIWNFAGDGGIIAFAFKGHENRSLLCGLDILRGLPLFNMTSVLPLDEMFTLRLGVNTGKVRFFIDTGSIVSDVINYAAHLEKQVAEPGKLTVSHSLKESVEPRIMTIFEKKGVFEDQEYYQTVNRLDLI